MITESINNVIISLSKDMCVYFLNIHIFIFDDLMISFVDLKSERVRNFYSCNFSQRIPNILINKKYPFLLSNLFLGNDILSKKLLFYKKKCLI